jgi:hypothetical protein
MIWGGDHEWGIGNGMKRTRHELFLCSHGDSKENHERSQITSNPAEIRTEQLSNTSLGSYQIQLHQNSRQVQSCS